MNPQRVLKDLVKPPAEIPEATGEPILVPGRSRCGTAAVPAAPTTPVTPVTAEAFISLHDLILEKDTHALNEIEKQRFQRHLQKLTKAAQTSIARGVLQQERIKFLLKTNVEARLRHSTKSLVLGKAKVMSYEDLAAARVKRSEKEANKAAKKARGRKRKGGKQQAGMQNTAPGGLSVGTGQSVGGPPTVAQSLSRGPSLLAQEQRRSHGCGDLPVPARSPLTVLRWFSTTYADIHTINDSKVTVVKQ